MEIRLFVVVKVDVETNGQMLGFVSKLVMSRTHTDKNDKYKCKFDFAIGFFLMNGSNRFFLLLVLLFLVEIVKHNLVIGL